MQLNVAIIADDEVSAIDTKLKAVNLHISNLFTYLLVYCLRFFSGIAQGNAIGKAFELKVFKDIMLSHCARTNPIHIPYSLSNICHFIFKNNLIRPCSMSIFRYFF